MPHPGNSKLFNPRFQNPKGSAMSQRNDAGFPIIRADRVAEHQARFEAGLAHQDHIQREADALRVVRDAAPALLAALRAVLPYAESRLEDMEEEAERVASGDLKVTDDGKAHGAASLEKARAAFEAARTALALADGSR